MLPDALRETLESRLDITIHGCSRVGGGCIANACRLETDDAPLFLKYGDAQVARTFPGEAAGLEAMRAAESPLTIPAVIDRAGPDEDRPGFLVMEWVETGTKSSDFWEDFGQGLAQMHRHAHEQYGFEQDNFIGRLPQQNEWTEAWPVFFRTQRLEPQVRMARERDRWQKQWTDALKALYRRLPDLLPETPEASVLHGDLWKGNYMVTAAGDPAIIDPAAYYGHREADLAMTELFGGYQDRFYDAYLEAWPLAPGYDTRKDVYNLYHLINHLNLFGAGYASAVEGILSDVG